MRYFEADKAINEQGWFMVQNSKNPLCCKRKVAMKKNRLAILSAIILAQILSMNFFIHAAQSDSGNHLPERYKYKEINEFKGLESFNSVDEFESYFQEYITDCLAHTGGGTGGNPCLISHKMWDRELNTYYQKLMNLLQEEEKKLLRESQRTWIQERDQSITFNSRLLDIKYKGYEMGTMFSLMRAGDADRLMSPIVKQRALLLKAWYEFVKAGSF